MILAIPAVYFLSKLEHAAVSKYRGVQSLWNQQEVLNGALFLKQYTVDDWGYGISNVHIIYKPEYKFWHSGGDRKMEDLGISLLEHYHHARELTLGIISMDRIIKRGGKILGFFA